MPRPRRLIPKLCENTKGYLFARGPDGRQHWFGHKSDATSGDRYAAFLSAVQRGEMASAARLSPPATRPKVNLLCLRFLTDYATRYRQSDGRPSAEVDCFKCVIRLLREHFGTTVADEFGPLRLRVVRDAMVAAGWSRRWINKQVGRIRLIFRIGVSWEIVRPEVVVALKTLPPLVIGETTAPERSRRRAVNQEDLEAVRRHLNERQRDIFDLLLLTGARPGELLSLTTGMIDRQREVWRADLAHHKTAYKGKLRTLFFNATAQRILAKHLHEEPNARLFPLRRSTFGTAVKRACEVAFGMPEELRKPDRSLPAEERAEIRRKATEWRQRHVFTPHWLRHTVATRLADSMDTEGAQRLLGHATRAMTEHYSQSAERQAVEAVKKLG